MMENSGNMHRWTQGWLNYLPREYRPNRQFLRNITVIGFENDARVSNAIKELKRGIKGMTGVTPRLWGEGMHSGLRLVARASGEIPAEGYRIHREEGGLYLEASDGSGILYAAFHVLRWVAMEKIWRSCRCSVRLPILFAC